MNEYTINIKKLQEKLSALYTKADHVKQTLDVMSFDQHQEKFVKSYNKEKYFGIQKDIAKCKLDIGIFKYLHFRRSKKHLLQDWDAYKNLLDEELENLKLERTIRISDKKWVADMTMISLKKQFIMSEYEIFKSTIQRKNIGFIKIMDYIKSHVWTIIFLLLGFPAVVGLFIAMPILDWLPIQNDWIGFWGNYSGGIVGAIIGGLVALKISRMEIENQKNIDREAKITELKLKSLPDFIALLVEIQQKLLMDSQYVFMLYDEMKKYQLAHADACYIEDNNILPQLTKNCELIRSNKLKIYDLLEAYQKSHQLNKFFVWEYDQRICIIHSIILQILKSSSQIETLFDQYSNIENKYSINLKSFNDGMDNLDKEYKNIDYMIYELIVLLRNNISSDLFNVNYTIQSKEDYIKDRFHS